MRTDRRTIPAVMRRRPESPSGRRRILLALCVVVGAALSGSTARASSSGDLFSWWHRDLLPISFEPGGWVRVAREDVAEGQVMADTLTCRVLEAPGQPGRWIQIELEHPAERWLVHVDLESLGPGHRPLDAILDLVQVLPGGALQHEDIQDLQASEFAQKTLEDVFENPTVEIVDLPDSTHGATVLGRQRATLTETLTTSVPMGDRTMVHTTELRSEAVLSAQVPILGLLVAETTTVTSTRWEGNVRGHASSRPPLVTETRTWCLGFGVGVPLPLPAGLGR